MPGGHLRTFRIGNRSELLVEQLLAGLAFTARVPRQEDVGVDFFCSLISQRENFLQAGPFFAVQAKSPTDAIRYEKPHELDWITTQENPLLLCIADRKALAMDVYSTWNLLCGVLGGWRGQKQPNSILLRPGVAYNKWPGVVDQDDGSQAILLDKPIARITDADIFDETRMQQIAAFLGEWTALDRTNIVNRHAGMYWVAGPLAYETNKSPWASGQAGVQFYYNPSNLKQGGENLGRVVTGLTLLLPQIADMNQPPWTARMSALQAVLHSHWELFDEPVRRVLTDNGFTR